MRQPLLVGQSLGGHTALLAAAAHPGLFGGLVLVEAGPGGRARWRSRRSRPCWTPGRCRSPPPRRPPGSSAAGRWAPCGRTAWNRGTAAGGHASTGT
ncbi:alpha/beta hydrolase-fold protein [Kitasatospora albolonga]|uniref:alpha/beta hydrolase-fold protein n=1 Tax=Kitasatospora albolonga TaxID=68173 RepID=UPI003CD0B6DD